MNKIKLLIYTLVIFTANRCLSQKESNENQIINELHEKIPRMEFSLFLFLENELINACVDTSSLSKFNNYVKAHSGFKGKTIYDQRESELSLHLLYVRILNFKPNNSELSQSREHLLNFLSRYKNIDFKVDEQLILNQIDSKKRSLINGYDEGVIKESWLIFFNYDPILFKSVLIKNNKEKSWNKAYLFLCNAFRENSIPLSIRYRLKEKAIFFLNKYKSQDSEFETQVKKITECDVSVNLYD